MPTNKRKYNFIKLSSDSWVIDTNSNTVYHVGFDNNSGVKKAVSFEKAFNVESNLAISMYEGTKVPVRVLNEAIWSVRKQLFSAEENNQWKIAMGY